MVIALCIIALLVLLLISPLKAALWYEDERFRVQAGVGAVMITVFDSQKPKKKKAASSKKDSSEGEISEKDKKAKSKLSLDKIKEIFSLFYDILKFLKKHLVFYEFTAKLDFGLESAAQTGILTGAAWGVFYNIVGLIDRTFVLKKHSVNVVPDFEEEKFDFIFRCGTRIRVFWALVLAFALLKNIKRIRKVMQS